MEHSSFAPSTSYQRLEHRFPTLDSTPLSSDGESFSTLSDASHSIGSLFEVNIHARFRSFLHDWAILRSLAHLVPSPGLSDAQREQLGNQWANLKGDLTSLISNFGPNKEDIRKGFVLRPEFKPGDRSVLHIHLTSDAAKMAMRGKEARDVLKRQAQMRFPFHRICIHKSLVRLSAAESDAELDGVVPIGGFVILGEKWLGLAVAHQLPEIGTGRGEVCGSPTTAPGVLTQGDNNNLSLVDSSKTWDHGYLPWLTRNAKLWKSRYPRGPLASDDQTEGAADWALYNVDACHLHPNMIFDPQTGPEALWAALLTDTARPDTVSGDTTINIAPILIPGTVPANTILRRLAETGLIDCLVLGQKRNVAAVIIEANPSLVIEGQGFDVLTIATRDPLTFGSSGSWVVVEEGLCGVVLAGIADEEDDEHHDVDEDGFPHEAYIIPIEDVFRNITASIGGEAVRLPTLNDWCIKHLEFERSKSALGRPQGQREEIGFDKRHLLFESFLAKQRTETRQRQSLGQAHSADNFLSMEPNVQRYLSHTLPHPAMAINLGTWHRRLVEETSSLKVESLQRLLVLYRFCPISGSVRNDFARQITSFRRRATVSSLISSTILDTFLATVAGEKVLCFVFFLLFYFRSVDGDKVLVVSEVLSHLFEMLEGDDAAKPTSEQLVAFVTWAARGFRPVLVDTQHLVRLTTEYGRTNLFYFARFIAFSATVASQRGKLRLVCGNSSGHVAEAWAPLLGLALEVRRSQTTPMRDRGAGDSAKARADVIVYPDLVDAPGDMTEIVDFSVIRPPSEGVPFSSLLSGKSSKPDVTWRVEGHRAYRRPSAARGSTWRRRKTVTTDV